MTLYEGLKVAHTLIARRPLGAGHPGFRRVEIGKEELTYTVELETSLLNKMALDAVKDKSGKAKRGPVTVRITSRRRLEPSKKGQNR